MGPGLLQVSSEQEDRCAQGDTRSLSSVEAYDISADRWTPAAAALNREPNALYVLTKVDASSFLIVGGFNGTSGADMQPQDGPAEARLAHDRHQQQQ